MTAANAKNIILGLSTAARQDLIYRPVLLWHMV